MRTKTKIWSMLSFAAMVALSACHKKDETTPTGKVKLEFFNVAGGSNLNLNNQWYTNANGDSFTVSRFNYYISNVSLKSANGATYTEANSYHLVQQEDLTSTSFDMSDVPNGSYSSITFTIGVDSLHNVSGAQTGALDPVNGMFWSWNTGYIMLKFEGNSPKSTQPDGKLMFHCGGFSGANSVLKTITLNFPQAIQVNTSTPHVHLQADVLQLFNSPNKIDFSNLMIIHMPGADAKSISDNYANMFTITYAGA
ncbi:MbnP family protein [Taibaiella soli]|uniref:Copper-binding protein MbnP-like domain-containing protein n=1 Tax=Taibaiella soli TaxID=1649169 RepID=A0A2W2AH69_9BACT|nr:MbnP family protein [Taibaiella soli]PZF72882.1 hypothetical protein DN068_10745 [Taibaiella soli]